MRSKQEIIDRIAEEKKRLIHPTKRKTISDEATATWITAYISALEWVILGGEK